MDQIFLSEIVENQYIDFVKENHPDFEHESVMACVMHYMQVVEKKSFGKIKKLACNLHKDDCERKKIETSDITLAPKDWSEKVVVPAHVYSGAKFAIYEYENIQNHAMLEYDATTREGTSSTFSFYKWCNLAKYGCLEGLVKCITFPASSCESVWYSILFEHPTSACCAVKFAEQFLSEAMCNKTREFLKTVQMDESENVNSRFDLLGGLVNLEIFNYSRELGLLSLELGS